MAEWGLDQLDRELSKETAERKKQLNRYIVLYRELRKVLNSKGWQKIVSPLLDSMIYGVVGGKSNGKWDPGLIQKARTDERREYYIGYKQFGIDLYNRVQNYIKMLEKYEKMLKNIILQEKKGPQYRQPMQKGRYSQEERI